MGCVRSEKCYEVATEWIWIAKWGHAAPGESTISCRGAESLRGNRVSGIGKVGRGACSVVAVVGPVGWVAAPPISLVKAVFVTPTYGRTRPNRKLALSPHYEPSSSYVCYTVGGVSAVPLVFLTFFLVPFVISKLEFY